jgi:hypothetical protein
MGIMYWDIPIGRIVCTAISLLHNYVRFFYKVFIIDMVTGGYHHRLDNLGGICRFSMSAEDLSTPDGGTDGMHSFFHFLHFLHFLSSFTSLPFLPSPPLLHFFSSLPSPYSLSSLPSFTSFLHFTSFSPSQMTTPATTAAAAQVTNTRSDEGVSKYAGAK